MGYVLWDAMIALGNRGHHVEMIVELHEPEADDPVHATRKAVSIAKEDHGIAGSEITGVGVHKIHENDPRYSEWRVDEPS